MQPFEIVLAQADLYIAMEGEPFPAVNATPAGNWAMLGVGGRRNQTEPGVKISHSQEINQHYTLGGQGPVKAIRTREGVMIDVVIEDLTPETYAKALNLAGITEVVASAGVAGTKTMGLRQGIDVITFALLVRVPGVSPMGDGMSMQWEFTKVFQNSNPEMVLNSQGDAVGLAFQFVQLEDFNQPETERLGRFVTQSAFPL